MRVRAAQKDPDNVPCATCVETTEIPDCKSADRNDSTKIRMAVQCAEATTKANTGVSPLRLER